MKVRCLGNRGEHLPSDVLLASGNTPYSRFNVTIGEEYLVRAMALWTYGLGILMVDDTRRPNWKLAVLFEFTDRRIPEGWEFTPVEDLDPVRALWGYPTMIRDPQHYEDLIERRAHALDAFRQETGATTRYDERS